MTSVEDFTEMTTGEEIALEGRVARCSRCGRNGIEHAAADGGTGYVIHVQTSRVFGDGMLTEPSDYCVIEERLDAEQSAAPPSPPSPASPFRRPASA
jgi:hypothetical protein